MLILIKKRLNGLSETINFNIFACLRKSSKRLFYSVETPFLQFLLQ